MTEAETSIEQLINDSEGATNGEIIDEILEEINKTTSNIELQEGPQSQMPQPQQMPQQMPQPQPQQEKNDVGIVEQYQNINDTPLIENLESTEKNMSYLKDNILEELKLPVVVLILYIIFSSSRLDGVFINTNNNFFVDTMGKITFPSLLIKGILLSLIFYVIKLFC